MQLHSNGWFPVLLANIRLGLAMANTIAYYDRARTMGTKAFIVQAPRIVP